MGQRIKEQDNELMSEINIVPFVDIILVVLIIFMVTAPIVMKPSLKIQLPEAASGEKTEYTPFQLVIASRENILLNGKQISFSAIQDLAQSFSLENPEGQAVISADEKVPHGDVIAILDKIKTGGIKKLGLSIRSTK